MSENSVRVVIDTQVFLRAALNRKSLPGKLIFDRRGQYRLLVADEIVAEVEEVLHRPKIRAKYPHLTDKIIEQILALMRDSESIEVGEIPEVSRDVKDDIFLECARAGLANYIVSEDKDLLVLHPYGNIQILNVIDFINTLK